MPQVGDLNSGHQDRDRSCDDEHEGVRPPRTSSSGAVRTGLKRRSGALGDSFVGYSLLSLLPHRPTPSGRDRQLQGRPAAAQVPSPPAKSATAQPTCTLSHVPLTSHPHSKNLPHITSPSLCLLAGSRRAVLRSNQPTLGRPRRPTPYAQVLEAAAGTTWTSPAF